MPRGKQIPIETWNAIRQAVESGERCRQVAERYQVKLSTLRRRSVQEKWKTPTRREKGNARVDGDTRVSDFREPEPHAINATNSQLQLSRNNGAQSELLAAAQAGPDEYREALKKWAKIALAEGAPDVPPPRTLAEMKTLVDILDKAEKMGAPTADNRFVRALPSLSRGKVIDADPIPEIEGFRI